MEASAALCSARDRVDEAMGGGGGVGGGGRGAVIEADAVVAARESLPTSWKPNEA